MNLRTDDIAINNRIVLLGAKEKKNDGRGNIHNDVLLPRRFKNQSSDQREQQLRRLDIGNDSVLSFSRLILQNTLQEENPLNGESQRGRNLIYEFPVDEEVEDVDSGRGDTSAVAGPPGAALRFFSTLRFTAMSHIPLFTNAVSCAFVYS